MAAQSLLLIVVANAGTQQTPRGCTVWCARRPPARQLDTMQSMI